MCSDSLRRSAKSGKLNGAHGGGVRSNPNGMWADDHRRHCLPSFFLLFVCMCTSSSDSASLRYKFCYSLLFRSSHLRCRRSSSNSSDRQEIKQPSSSFLRATSLPSLYEQECPMYESYWLPLSIIADSTARSNSIESVDDHEH